MFFFLSTLVILLPFKLQATIEIGGNNSANVNSPPAYDNSALDKIGKCQSGGLDFKSLQRRWANYHAEYVERIRANAKKINTEARFGPITYADNESGQGKPIRMIKALYRVEAYLKQLETNPSFQPTDPAVMADLKLLKLEFKVDLATPDRKKGAMALLAFFKSKGVTPLKLTDWSLRPPLASEVPFPPASFKDDFTKSYRDSVGQALNTFLETNGPPLKYKAPTEDNAFDQHIASQFQAEDKAQFQIDGRIVTANKSQLEAIDGVARTIWGESLSCARQGLPQFEAIAKNIADRSLAVCKPVGVMLENEANKEREEEMAKIDAENSSILERLGFLNGPPKFRKPPKRVNMRAINDYGRKDQATTMDCAAQVISKPGQYSVWNSHKRNTSSLKQLGARTHPNIPNVQVTIRSQQGEGDDAALLRALCPEPNNPNSEMGRSAQMQDLWKKVVSLAKDVVLRPQYVSDTYQWVPPQKEVYFYTHGPSLDFAKEVPVIGIKVPKGPNGESETKLLRGIGPGSCNQFRLFQPRTLGEY